jgi:hypothetical protein
MVPLLAWWSHIVIDVFTNSADYYAAPALSVQEQGFDGIAWTTPCRNRQPQRTT